MKQISGLWFPDDERYMDRFAGPHGWHFQEHKLAAALQFVKNRRTAVDVGAHCGLWAMHLAMLFQKVVAFEPLSENAECFHRNVAGNYELHVLALGHEAKSVGMSRHDERSTVFAYVSGDGDIPMRTLDSFGLEEVDFLKADCEGFEYYVMLGAKETLLRCKPCVIVEQKPNNGPRLGLGVLDAVDFLKGLGAVLRGEIAGDYILSW